MSFQLTDEAVEDLHDIFEYTEEKFGFNQAVCYLEELDVAFEFIGSNPKSGKSRSEIKQGLQSFSKDNHLVFYRMVSDAVRVVRVLHGSQDLPKQF
jgi:toxin ParE1/3/4